MFLRFFYELKQSGIPVSVKEYLTFLERGGFRDRGQEDRRLSTISPAPRS